MTKEHIHFEMGEEVRFISGSYSFLREELLPYQGREVFCLVGVGCVDNSCCGVTGCIFVRIPGYVVSWRRGKNRDGMDITDVDPIEDEREQKEIEKLLDARYPRVQVYFGIAS